MTKRQRDRERERERERETQREGYATCMVLWLAAEALGTVPDKKNVKPLDQRNGPKGCLCITEAIKQKSIFRKTTK